MAPRQPDEPLRGRAAPWPRSGSTSSAVEPGTQLTVLWQGKPVFIRARTEEEIAAAREVDVAELVDPIANNANLAEDAPATDENRALAPPRAPSSPPAPGSCRWASAPIWAACRWASRGDFGGWFCPCHGSHYDTAGRIRRGPAPRNLPVPVAAFVDAATIQLG